MTGQGLKLAAVATGPTMIVTLGILAAFGPMSMDMYLPSLPTIQDVFAATTGEVQLTLSCFTIGFAIGQLVYGPLSDRFGRRWVLISGILLYTVASLLCIVARDIDELIVVRFIQALGGGAGTVLTRAVVRDLYTKDAAARVLSLIVMVTMVAPLVAPFLGGYILKYLSWRAIFWLLVVFGALCLALTVFGLPETLPRDRRRGGGLRLVLTAYVAVLRDRQAIGYMLCGAFSFAGFFAQLSGSPFVYIQMFGVAPEDFALLFGINVIGVMLGAYINARWVARVGIRRMLAGATTLAVIGGLLLAAVSTPEAPSLAAIVICLLIFMLPHNITNANATAGALENFGEIAGTASAAIGASRFGIGATIGALVGFLHDGTAIPMAFTVAGCAVASAAAFWLMTSDRRRAPV